MIARHQKTVDPGHPEEGKETAERHSGAVHDDACRCREASEMTPRELLRTMFSDLAFWKKAKKG